MSMSLWQKWNDIRFRKFLKEFYGDKIELSKEIAKGKGCAKYAPLVFDKIATPAVYLKLVYKAWLDKHEHDEEDEACEAVLSEEQGSTGVELDGR